MRLREYLEEQRLTDAEFGRLVGATQPAVSRWASGARLPRPKMVARIQEVTGGKVSAADFYANAGQAEAA